MMTTLSKVSIKNGKCPSPLHFTQDYFRVFCIFQNQVLHLQSYLLTICNSKSIIHDCSHLKRLHKGSAQCWGLLVWKLFRKFGLFRSSMWFLNIRSKILLLWLEEMTEGGAGVGLGGVGELETSLSCPLSSAGVWTHWTVSTWNTPRYLDCTEWERNVISPQPGCPRSDQARGRSSWSSWCLSSAAAGSGRCCPVWGKLWSLTGPGPAWRAPQLGRRRWWSPREDPHPGGCASGPWRSWAPPPGPGSSCCPCPGWPSWSCCCSAAASENCLEAPATSQQS